MTSSAVLLTGDSLIVSRIALEWGGLWAIVFWAIAFELWTCVGLAIYYSSKALARESTKHATTRMKHVRQAATAKGYSTWIVVVVFVLGIASNIFVFFVGDGSILPKTCPGTDFHIEVTTQNIRRTAIVHLPTHNKSVRQVPLVVSFHPMALDIKKWRPHGFGSARRRTGLCSCVSSGARA